MAAKFAEGDRVRFRPSSNKAISLTGVIARIHEDERSADVEVDVDGKLVEVEHTETVALADCEIEEE